MIGAVAFHFRYAAAHRANLAFMSGDVHAFMRGARSPAFRIGPNEFKGNIFALPSRLYEKMGINAKYFDGELRILVLAVPDYDRYDKLMRQSTSGVYLNAPRFPGAEALIGNDVNGYLQSRTNSKLIVVPKGFDLATLLHETLHDIYLRKLTAEEVDRFITASAAYIQELLAGSTARKILNTPQGMLLADVSNHSGRRLRELVSPAEVNRLRAQNPSKPLRDILKPCDLKFFSELFAMAGEVYFGFKHPLPHGMVPEPVKEFYASIEIRQALTG
ncbi:hypothetical protein HZC34_06000 [Candidatus Saganbacteria bacterium]|nr:hypothetical protein [Candidatus Saganbacteria bacterium]